MKLWVWILWPSFVVAAAANALFFSFFDPADLHPHAELAPGARVAAYTIGFFAFWALGALSSAFTCFLQRGAHEVNLAMCPLDDARRPPGCRGDGDERLT